MKHIGAACAVLVLLAGPACRMGQPMLVSSQGDMTTPGTIGGIVSAVGGDRLAERGVHAVQVGTSQRFSAVTNVTGGFTIKVPPGEYHLEVDLHARREGRKRPRQRAHQQERPRREPGDRRRLLAACAAGRGRSSPHSSCCPRTRRPPTRDDSAPPRRPTIGVALEGGSAFGLAHIGVLEWFEAHHIPIDYVAGTSMGALIGGLYAAGKTPAELRDLTQELDWDLVLGGTTPYRNLTFRRREDLRAYPNSFLIGLRHGVRLPPGLNAGQQITLLMDRETLAYSEIKIVRRAAHPVPLRGHGAR